MGYKGYSITYSIKWQSKKSAYLYQRFFRAIYGYVQVVSKSNGRRYVYNRQGVLTNYPFIKAGRTTVIVPDVAFQPIITFLKTGKNPAHQFSFVSNWTEIVKYSIEETVVDADAAGHAVLSAINRVHVHLVGGDSPAQKLLQSLDVLDPEQIYALYYSLKNIIDSGWFPALQTVDPQIYERVQALLNALRF